MTHEEVSKLTDEEIRIKVAELCGWKSIEPYKPEGCQLYKDLFGLKRGRFGQIPNYPQDLNACHKVVNSWTDPSKWFAYDTHIARITRKAGTFSWNATARQRAEAFLMTMTAGD